MPRMFSGNNLMSLAGRTHPVRKQVKRRNPSWFGSSSCNNNIITHQHHVLYNEQRSSQRETIATTGKSHHKMARSTTSRQDSLIFDSYTDLAQFLEDEEAFYHQPSASNLQSINDDEWGHYVDFSSPSRSSYVEPPRKLRLLTVGDDDMVFCHSS